MLDHRFLTSELLIWDLLTSQSAGTFWATFSLLAFLGYRAVERRLVYTGPRGLRSHNIFRPPRNASFFKREIIVLPLKMNKLTIRRTHSSSGGSVGSIGSQESDHSLAHPTVGTTSNALAPPILVYHESARSIVFRDHLRRAADVEQSAASGLPSEPASPNHYTPAAEATADHEHLEEDFSMEVSAMDALFGGNGSSGFMNERVAIQGFTPNIVPLPPLELGPNDQYLPLLDSHDRSLWTAAEREVVDLLDSQHAVVKTIKNNDWTDFLHRFKTPHPPKGRYPDDHNDIPANGDYTFNCFVTSTSLLPAGAKKMRCYGAAAVYTSGIVFALPKYEDTEAENKVVETTRTVRRSTVGTIFSVLL